MEWRLAEPITHAASENIDARLFRYGLDQQLWMRSVGWQSIRSSLYMDPESDWTATPDGRLALRRRTRSSATARRTLWDMRRSRINRTAPICWLQYVALRASWRTRLVGELNNIRTFLGNESCSKNPVRWGTGSREGKHCRSHRRKMGCSGCGDSWINFHLKSSPRQMWATGTLSAWLIHLVELWSDTWRTLVESSWGILLVVRPTVSSRLVIDNWRISSCWNHAYGVYNVRQLTKHVSFQVRRNYSIGRCMTSQSWSHVRRHCSLEVIMVTF